GAAGEENLALTGQGGGLRTEVDGEDEAGFPGEAQHRGVAGTEPAQGAAAERGMVTAQPQGRAVQVQEGTFVGELGLDAAGAPLRRLGQPRCGRRSTVPRSGRASPGGRNPDPPGTPRE